LQEYLYTDPARLMITENMMSQVSCHITTASPAPSQERKLREGVWWMRDVMLRAVTPPPI